MILAGQLSEPETAQQSWRDGKDGKPHLAKEQGARDGSAAPFGDWLGLAYWNLKLKVNTCNAWHMTP